MSTRLQVLRRVHPVLGGPRVLDWADSSFCQQGDRLLWRGRPFEGQREQYRGGELIKRAAYTGGLLEGDVLSWYPDGALYAHEGYRQGRKVGAHASWWADGRPRLLYHYVDGRHHGQAREWYENGRLARCFHYEHGHQHGVQLLYRPDGSLLSRYRMRAGQRCAGECPAAPA